MTRPFHLFKGNSILKISVLELLAHPVRLLTWLLYRFENTEIAFTHASKNFYPLELEGVPPVVDSVKYVPISVIYKNEPLPWVDEN